MTGYMDAQAVFDKYYKKGTPLYDLVWNHSRKVADKALSIVDAHPEFGADRKFVEEAALLHDLGVFLTDAPEIECRGYEPYICHGILGAEILRKEGFPRHALVCERHTGTGLSREDIERQNLPIPSRDMLPESIEEKIICYADKFYSKSHPDREKTVEKIRTGIQKYGTESLPRFDEWSCLFHL